MPGLKLAYSEQPNVAPRKPLQSAMESRAQDKTVLVEIDWFQKVKKELLAENKTTWDNQTLLWELMFLFIEGKQLLKRSRYGQGWRTAPLPDRTDSPVYSQNLVGFYSDNIRSKWTQSNTDVNWRPTSDADQQQGAAKAATHIHDYYKRKLYTERFKQTEAALAQCGKYARYYYYSEEAKSYGRRPIIEPQQVQFGDGYWFCADCGAGGSASELGDGMANPGISAAAGGMATNPDGLPADVRGGQLSDMRDAFNAQYGHDELAEWEAGLEAPHPPEEEIYEEDEGQHLAETGQSGAATSGMGATCPNCGSPNIEAEEPAQAEVEAVTGYEQIELGDLVCETVPAFELKHDLTKTPQDSPYLIRRRRVRVPLLQAKFPDIQIKPLATDDRGLGAEDDLKRSVYSAPTPMMAMAYDVAGEPTADLIQIWLDPCMYSQSVLKDDFETVSGQVILAGTRLAEMFPDGLYMAWIEGVNGCVELRNEHHRDYWVGSEYRLRAISSMGSGIEDIIEGQRQYNLIMSIIYTQLRTSAMPATLYDARLLPSGVSSYLGSLQNIPVELAALDDKRSLGDAVHQLSPQPPTQAHFEYGNQLNNFMQLASRVTDFSGGLPGVNNSTATGAQIAAANSQSLFGPQLALKAEVDRRGAEIILALFKKYAIDERYVSLAGKRGEQDGIWLSQADLSVDVFAEVAPDSYLPQTNLERRERWQGLLMDLGGLPGLKMAMTEMPQMVEHLAELYDVDLGAEDYTAAAELSRERVDQMAQALPMWQMMAQTMPPTQMEVDPMTGAAMEVPVDPMAEAGQFLVGILQPPIELEEMGHLSAIMWCREWLTTDEGKKAPAELRAGVKAMIAAHLEGMMAEAQMTGAVAMAGQPMPVMPEQDADGAAPPKNNSPDAKQMQGGANKPKRANPKDSITKGIVASKQLV